MDKLEAKDIQERIKAALKPLAEELGFELVMRGGTIDGDVLDTRVRFQKAGTTREAQDLVRYGDLYGLKAEDLGKTFQRDGHTWTITGIKMGDRKGKPILIKREDGRLFRTARVAAELLGRTEPPTTVRSGAVVTELPA